MTFCGSDLKLCDDKWFMCVNIDELGFIDYVMLLSTYRNTNSDWKSTLFSWYQSDSIKYSHVQTHTHTHTHFQIHTPNVAHTHTSRVNRIRNQKRYRSRFVIQHSRWFTSHLNVLRVPNINFMRFYSLLCLLIEHCSLCPMLSMWNACVFVISLPSNILLQIFIAN